jgi:BirA family transcriptional regulator, biotin operon repressor / biotin---[acetyl-CoA-carboxylase] ligase
MVHQETVTAYLAGLAIPATRWYDSIGSTNDIAMEWCASGAPEGSLVIADTQTSGRGRLGRKWITEPGSALAFSLICKPSASEMDHLVLFSPLGALAICQALERDWGLHPLIKWPNDVLLDGRKVSGILVEAAWFGETLQGIVVGIGVNVAPSSVPPDQRVFFPATSVEQAVGHALDRFTLLRSILQAILEWRTQMHGERFFQEWEKRLAFRGQWVRLDIDAQKANDVEAQPKDEDESVSGVLTGIDPSGNLLLRLASGEMRSISVGDVHLRPVSH